MRRIAKVLLGASVAWVCFGSNEANASTDLPGLYDARAVAIGGTGPSYVENGASVFLNPATLDGIKTFAGSLTLSPIRPTLTTPALGPETSVTSKGQIFPLFLVGAGYRLSDRFTVGLAVYSTAGFGSNYDDDVPGKMDFTLAQFEASPAVAVKVVDGLSLGLGYRITYTSEKANLPATSATSPASEIDLNGLNFFGLHAGVYYRPTHALHLGLTYRTRVTTSIDGTTKSGGASLDTKSKFTSPDRIRLGASYSLLDDKLLLALDLKYVFFKPSNKALNLTVSTPVGDAEQTIPLNWKNVFGVGAGAEYWVVSKVALRGGYSISQSATPASTASVFTPPPALLHGIHFGVGLALPDLDLDAGGLYTFSKKAHVDGGPGVIPGDYSLSTTIVSLSATYHM